MIKAVGKLIFMPGSAPGQLISFFKGRIKTFFLGLIIVAAVIAFMLIVIKLQPLMSSVYLNSEGEVSLPCH